MLRTPKICLEHYGRKNNTIEKPQLIGEPQQYGASGFPMGYHGWWSRFTDSEDNIN